MDKLTMELINKIDNNDNLFWRFQDPKLEVGEESWGMIYSSREEAIQDYMDTLDISYEEAESQAILPGKSCELTFKEIMSYACEFDKSYNLIVFEGSDTYTTGHDGECVANYYSTVYIFKFEDAVNFYNNYF